MQDVYVYIHTHILYKACIYYPNAHYLTRNKKYYTWFTVGVINMKQDNQQSSPVTRISWLCHVLTLCLHEIPFNNKCILTATTYFSFNTECIISVPNLWLPLVQHTTEIQATVRTSLFWNCHLCFNVWATALCTYGTVAGAPHAYYSRMLQKQWQLHCQSTVTALAFSNKVQCPVPSAHSIKTWISSFCPKKGSKESHPYTEKHWVRDWRRVH